MTWRIGVDAGGTFTDVCLFDDSTGRIELWKLVSTPGDPARGIAQAIEEAIARSGLADAAARLPVRSARFDPSAGVLGAREMARLAGFDSLISFDMGGAGTAVALLEAGPAAEPPEAPPPDIRVVGAGGGSVAVVNADGVLTLHPGGVGPTVTDAHLVLRTLNPDHPLGGRVPLHPELSHVAIGALAATLGSDSLSAAERILSAVTETLAGEIRLIAAQRGQDPRDRTLVAFGGAGPLHAARLARALDIPRILVPRHPGMLGALGLLLADLRAGFSATLPMPLGADALPAIAEAFGLLRHRAAVWFAEQAIPARARSISRSVDLRHAGQPHDLEVPLPDGPVTAAMLESLQAVFAAAHRHIHGPATGAVELIAVRLAAAGLLARPGFQPRPDAGPEAAAARTGSRDVWLAEAGGWTACPVHDRDRLESGNRIAGPAIVEQMDATTLILPGMTARVDPFLNLVLQDGG